MSQTQNPKLVEHIASYLRTPPKAESKPAEPRLADRVAVAVRENRDRDKAGRVTASGIMWPQNPTPTNPPAWTPNEVARFLQMIARTDDLTGNCC